ncbi:MAG: hypothetical protein AB7H90_06320 [Alphaproteobacteria bacterium]
MQTVLYFKRLLPLSFRRFAQVAVARSSDIAIARSTIANRMNEKIGEAEAANAALADRMNAIIEETEAANTALAELAHRTSYLKTKIEHLDMKLRNLSDDVDTLILLKGKISTLEIELANCRNLADVTFQAVETLQLGQIGTGT